MSSECTVSLQHTAGRLIGAYELQSILPPLIKGNGFLIREYIGDCNKRQKTMSAVKGPLKRAILTVAHMSSAGKVRWHRASSAGPQLPEMQSSCTVSDVRNMAGNWEPAAKLLSAMMTISDVATAGTND